MNTKPCPTEERLTELEIKISFQEDLLEQLNQTVFRQQEQIDLLIRDLRELKRNAPADGVSGSRSPLDERPPHY